MYRKKYAVISLLMVVLSLYGCVNKSSNTIDNSSNKKTANSQEENNDKEKQAQQEAQKIKQLEDTYRPILESGKKYESMTNEEGQQSVNMIRDWPKLTSEYKNKYLSAKNEIYASKEEYDKKKKAEEDAKKEAERIASYNTGVTYEQLARTPDDYKAKKVTFTGKVIQVLQNENETDIRLAVNDDYNKIIFIGYKPDTTNVRILENDNVIIRGTSIGIINYTSAFGVPISIPGVWVEEIKLNN